VTNEEAIAEVERQLDLFPRIALDLATFHKLQAMCICAPEPRLPWDYECVWGSHPTAPNLSSIHGYVLTAAHARNAVANAYSYLTRDHTKKLVGI
jgi:hypothetical protein